MRGEDKRVVEEEKRAGEIRIDEVRGDKEREGERRREDSRGE